MTLRYTRSGVVEYREIQRSGHDIQVAEQGPVPGAAVWQAGMGAGDGRHADLVAGQGHALEGLCLGEAVAHGGGEVKTPFPAIHTHLQTTDGQLEP